MLGLRKELDLANTAAAKLDVVSLNRDLAMAPIGVDLPFHFMHVTDGRVIEVLSPNKGGKITEELLTGGKIAGTRPRLDEGRALPVLPAAFIVAERRLGRDRDLGRGWVGTQAQIDTKHVAVLGTLLQQLHQIARQPDVK